MITRRGGYNRDVQEPTIIFYYDSIDGDESAPLASPRPAFEIVDSAGVSYIQSGTWKYDSVSVANEPRIRRDTSDLNYPIIGLATCNIFGAPYFILNDAYFRGADAIVALNATSYFKIWAANIVTLFGIIRYSTHTFFIREEYGGIHLIAAIRDDSAVVDEQIYYGQVGGSYNATPQCRNIGVGEHHSTLASYIAGQLTGALSSSDSIPSNDGNWVLTIDSFSTPSNGETHTITFRGNWTIVWDDLGNAEVYEGVTLRASKASFQYSGTVHISLYGERLTIHTGASTQPQISTGAILTGETSGGVEFTEISSGNASDATLYQMTQTLRDFFAETVV